MSPFTAAYEVSVDLFAAQASAVGGPNAPNPAAKAAEGCDSKKSHAHGKKTDVIVSGVLAEKLN